MKELEKSKIWLLYLFSGLFLISNLLFIKCNIYWFSLLPAAILILLLYLFSLDILVFVIVFFTPLSINIKDVLFGVGMTLPTEPLIFGIMILFFIKLFYEQKFDKNIIKHPITIAIIVNLLWILITSLTSQFPVVSIKFFVSRLWFVVTFYFIATQIFTNIKNIKRFLWLYIIPLFGVIAYTIINHALNGFTEKSSHWVMTPFYNDHTAYGAILAMFVPILIGFSFDKDYTKTIRTISVILTIILFIAIVLSYSRATWVSLGGGLLVYLMLVFKVKSRTIFIGSILMLIVFFLIKDDLFMKLEKNRQDSSNDLRKHLQSITNISSDASNLERINRWNSAFRMFEEKPILGWGPGTYQFVYAPFQLSKYKTIISTNAGDRGNAHSEYIGPLAESGILGALTFIIVIIYFITTSIKIYYRTLNNKTKNIVIIVLISFITYIIHGFLNNFLDTDKASVLFWGFMAIITALDVYHKSTENTVERH